LFDNNVSSKVTEAEIVMNHISMSIRDLTRSGAMLNSFDYIDIEDKKSHDYKGVFVPAHYAEAVKGFLAEKLVQEKALKLAQLMQFGGMLTGETQQLSIQALTEQRQ
jgi:hypothetical protein